MDCRVFISFVRIAIGLSLLTAAAAATLQSLDLRDYGFALSPRQTNSSLAGYLGAFFLGNVPSVYFYLSNGNDAVSIRALNRGQPVLRPTKGTGGVRDPALVRGGGPEEGRKWYIVGTDLNIGRVSVSHIVLGKLDDAKSCERSFLLLVLSFRAASAVIELSGGAIEQSSLKKWEISGTVMAFRLP